jgi:hypothetical protein
MKMKKISNVALASVMATSTMASSMTSVFADDPKEAKAVVLSTEEQTVIDKFKEDYKVLLDKKVDEVTKLDKEAITKALAEYDKFNANVKESLKAEFAKLKDMNLRIEHIEKFDKFKEDNKEILAKKVENVDIKDKDAVSKAVNDFNALVDPVKAMLKSEGELLKSFSTKINDEISNSNTVKSFKDTHKDIIAKSDKDLKSEDLAKIDKALDDYNRLTEAQKSVLKDEKAKLDALKSKLAKSDVDESAVKGFKNKYAAILAKDVKDVKESDLETVKQALAEALKLPQAQKDLLAKDIDKLNSFNNKFAANEVDKKVVENFKTKYKVILDLNEANVNNTHATDIKAAIVEYNGLTQAQKDMLKDEHTKLTALAKKLNINVDPKTSDAVSAVDSFKTKYKDILAKNANDSLTEAELAKVNSALDDYDKLNDTDKEALKAEKEKLDSLKKAKITKADPKTGNTNALIGFAGAIGTMIAGAGAFIGSKKLGKREE